MSEQAQVHPLIEKYQQLEIKHRVMVLGLLAALLLVIFDFAWYQPQVDQQEKLQRKLNTVQTQRKELVKAIEQRQQEIMGTAHTEQRKQVKSLQQHINNIDQQLSQYAHLVSPREMPELLRTFFKSSHKLELISLEKLPVKEAFKQVSKQQTVSIESTVAKQKVNFYRHEFLVVLEGRYFELLESLKQLETKDIKIYWDSLNYSVDQYPVARISLKVYTFSYDKNWIGA